MTSKETALQAIFEQETLLEKLYPSRVPEAKKRIEQIFQGFFERFPDHKQIGVYSAPGRTEIGGNHTDHQQGCVLCASIDKDALAIGGINQTDRINIFSKGYGFITVELSRLEVDETEFNTVQSLVKGVAAKMSQRFPIKGFDLYVSSDVLSGSGLSSSAAFEVLVGIAINDLFCGNHFNMTQLAQIGQYAENVYFGKPSGLMDQTACAVGGIIRIDFQDAQHPAIEQIDAAFDDYGVCIINSGANHADLTDAYAQITTEMETVAAFLGKSKLREVDEAEFYSRTPEVRKCCGDRAYLRAHHFFQENRRAVLEANALSAGDFPTFLKLVKESGISSFCYLQNIHVAGATEQQSVGVAIAVCEQILQGAGAVRVHGGGFAGTVQAFVPRNQLDAFHERCVAMLGESSCHITHIRPIGGVVLA